MVASLGTAAELITPGVNGWLYEPEAGAGKLRDILRVAMSENGAQTAALRQGARQTFEERFTEEANHTMLLACYERAIGTAIQDCRTATAGGPAV